MTCMMQTLHVICSTNWGFHGGMTPSANVSNGPPSLNDHDEWLIDAGGRMRGRCRHAAGGVRVCVIA